MSRIRFGACACLLALGLAGCSASTPTLITEDASTPPATSAAPPAAPPTDAAEIAALATHAPATDQTTVAPSAPPATSVRARRPATTDPKDWAPLTVALSATCVQRGDELIVTAETLPDSGIGFAVGYSEPPEGAERFVPDYAYFDRASNPTGTISWSFVVRPTTPHGPGVVKVVASTPDGRGAFASLEIEVTETC